MIATMEDLKEFLLTQLLREFDRIGRDLVNFSSWDKYSDMWFYGLQAGICKIEKINNPTDLLLTLLANPE